MASKLFTPFKIGNLELFNRITIAPMCQYSAQSGDANDWHMMHVGNLALSGASLLVMEATGVTPAGRISPGCLGLYSDENEQALARVVAFAHRISPIKVGVQLGHAGRKASSHRPWEGNGAVSPEQGGWPTVAPSAVPLASGWPTPEALDRAGMQAVKRGFVDAVRRAHRAGFDLIEIHSTHGYLLSEFLSPLANQRSDEYGGSLENRMRFPLEVFQAMREAWPADKPIGAKVTGTDYAPGGITPDEAVAYVRALKAAGCDYVTVSGGGMVLDAKVPVGPGYQVPYAEKVKGETGITTGAVGLISDPHQAERIVADNKADFVSIARAMLFNPRWGCHAAVVLGADAPYAAQYLRAHPKTWAPGKTLGRIE
jgi:2,4-dienoyl-CoA reductase-like NADH-dependent reductase (Old Yellow Enzyme family)